MPYTDILDNSAVDLTLVKSYLHIDPDDTANDSVLTLYLTAAKEAADNYCQDTFATVPAAIEIWILKIVALSYERKTAFMTKSDFKDMGSTEWKYNYDDYYHELKVYRREVGFGPF